MSKSGGGKLWLTQIEASVIDLAKPKDVKRVEWVKAEALKVAYGIEKIGPAIPETSDTLGRTVQVNLGLNLDQIIAIDKVRGGVCRGTWIRDVALRRAFNLQEKEHGKG